ncbi:hypothetical protein [Psychrobacillus antarcticus]|uniref:hypothetical protein n=1 Tax=Psychrobacillus antarcticus TaxID=2879115 RepID=UPI00240807BD|nr:hypothetical protein [Psychrobacillus antarcticus]
MRKILIILFTIIVLTACSNQETIKANGEGEYWKANITYEVTDSHLSDRGGIEYTGDEDLLYVSYSLVTDEGGLSGEIEPQKGQTAISFGMGGGNNPPAIDAAIISLNHAYVEIEWHTTTGEYKEKVELKVK